MKKPAPIKPLDPVLAKFIRALARETAKIDHDKITRGEKVSTEIEMRPTRKFRGRILVVRDSSIRTAASCFRHQP